MDCSDLLNFVNKFESITKKPEKYLSIQNDEADKIKHLTQELYEFSRSTEFPVKKSEALDKLVIDNLDEEQIWQQLELQNNSMLDNFISSVALLLSKKNELKFPLKKKTKKLSDNKIKIDEEINDFHDDGYNSDESKRKKSENKNINLPIKSIKSSIVDDKFFKLYEMEEFLEKIDENEGKKHSGTENGYDDDSNGSDVDYFYSDASTSDEDCENRPKYNDFFDQPYSEEVDNKKKRKIVSDDEGSEKKKVKFVNFDNPKADMNSDDESLFDAISNEKEVNISKDEEELMDSENDDSTTETENKDREHKSKSEPLSTFEARQERLKIKINKLEENALKEKPWQMKGEITADNRPQNSLLEEYVEFDIATRPAPVLTEKSTMRLEDIVKQRIKDKAWDDVVRKIKPADVEIEYKKKLVLDQEKSKQSLAEIYEQEYLKQAENRVNKDVIDKPEIEPPEHQEIKILLKKLFRKLDALSNFHFTPNPVSAEVKIISNLPAITMEEVTPMATSDAALLAPEEIKARHKGELIGKSERSSTDKKRERRKKKLKQRKKFKDMEKKIQEKLENSKNSSKNVYVQKLSNNLLQKITKSSNVTSLKESESKYLKSSSAFFSKLQDENKRNIQKKLELNKKKAI